MIIGLNNAIDWLGKDENYKFVFDGIGIFILGGILGGIFWLGKFLYEKYRKGFFLKIKKDKKNTNILFIDNKHFPIVDILRGSVYGYLTKRVKDIEGEDDPNIQNIDIFFVDILGVGKKMGLQREGFGIVEFLRRMFPKSKIVIYSEEMVRSDPAYSLADLVMSKDSDGYEFSKNIEMLIKKM